MLTTPADFALFMQAVMQGHGLRKEIKNLMLSPQIQILSKHEFPPFSTETTDENNPIRLSYGLGWGLYWAPYGKALFKEGHDDGWRNYTVCFDDAKTGIVIMTNSSKRRRHLQGTPRISTQKHLYPNRMGRLYPLPIRPAKKVGDATSCPSGRI
jgi:CubicO group peptidase (beta-lactamase class C family)